MVNINPKREIHRSLTAAEEWISGEILSDRLNISRVAVWKHLQKMKESGYPLLSSRQGYRLNFPEDTLAPWALELGGREVYHYASLSSTMDEARDLAESGVQAGAVVLAEEQSSGRGRLGRRWDSEGGGLYFTVIEYPKAPLSFIQSLNRAVVLAVRDFLFQEFSLEVWCREPNDLWTPEGKIAGVLLEVSGEIERIRYVDIGIGINIKNYSAPPDGSSLEQLTGQSFKRRILLKEFFPYYERNLKLNELEILSRWKEHLKPKA